KSTVSGSSSNSCFRLSIISGSFSIGVNKEASLISLATIEYSEKNCNFNKPIFSKYCMHFSNTLGTPIKNLRIFSYLGRKYLNVDLISPKSLLGDFQTNH